MSSYPRLDLTGQRFNRLTVLALSEEPRSPRSKRRWVCRCECGSVTTVSTSNLRGGAVKSCGCLLREALHTCPVTHGQTRGRQNPRVYRAWKAMHTRCGNPNIRDYKNYGGRGITVCARWRRFENFLADMGQPPEGTTLDRINNDLGYSPDNCRWSTPTEQANNTRRSRILTFQEISDTVAGWARRTGMPTAKIRSRLRYGWSVERTLTTP